MSKVITIIHLEPKPGVTPEAIEKAWHEFAPKIPPITGIRSRMLARAKRGDRPDELIIIREIESVEARNNLFPPGGGVNEEFDRAFANLQDLLENWYSLVTETATDYVEVKL